MTLSVEIFGNWGNTVTCFTFTLTDLTDIVPLIKCCNANILIRSLFSKGTSDNDIPITVAFLPAFFPPVYVPSFLPSLVSSVSRPAHIY